MPTYGEGVQYFRNRPTTRTTYIIPGIYVCAYGKYISKRPARNSSLHGTIDDGNTRHTHTHTRDWASIETGRAFSFSSRRARLCCCVREKSTKARHGLHAYMALRRSIYFHSVSARKLLVKMDEGRTHLCMSETGLRYNAHAYIRPPPGVSKRLHSPE